MNENLTTGIEIDVDRIDAELRDGWSFPSDWYYDPAHYEFELNAIFRSSWQYIGPREKLRKAGDFVTGFASGNVPVVVTCDRDGSLHGFINVCRHRGYVVANGEGNCRRLVCKYHAWAYDLDGKLIGAPGIQDEPSMKREEMGLLPVAVDTWGPAVFINLDTNAPPFTQMHPSFHETATKLGFFSDFDTFSKVYRFDTEITYEFDANWKLWYDNNTECYHCPTIHSESFSKAFTVEQGSFIERHEDDMLIYSFPPSETNENSNELRSTEQHAIQVFPAFSIMRQNDIMTMLQTVPTGPEKSRKILHFFAERSADPARVEQWIGVWNRTFEEDQEAVKIQQSALRSGHMPQCRYMTNQERATVYVNQLTWKAYKQHFGSTPVK